MKYSLSACAIVLVCVLFLPAGAFPCSLAIMTGPRPFTVDWSRQMVANSELILRVTAVEYVVAPQGNSRTTGAPATKVRFSVTDVVKGTYGPKELVLAGYLSNADEWNPGPAPYEGPRQSARAGSCFANTYRQNGEYLLVLQKNRTPGPGPSRTDDEYTVNWAPLAPVNEQLRPQDDPWLQWVREQLKAPSGGQR